VLHCNSYRVSWCQINISLIMNKVYFSKNDSKYLPNHTMSLPKRQSFSHSSSGRNNKSLTIKNSILAQRRIFQIWSLPFGTSCSLRNRCHRVPNLEPEDEGNIFPGTKFLMFKTTPLRRYEGGAVLSVGCLGTTCQGTNLAVGDQMDMLCRNVCNYQVEPRDVAEVRTFRLQRGGSWKSLNTTDCRYWEMIFLVNWITCRKLAINWFR
jgi:hypothetical protein